MRVTFSGADLHEFGTAGLDQRVKVILPLPGVGMTALPEDESWYDAWRQLPDAARNPIRTYTVRAVRQAEREIDIDFVLHGDGGPASRWAAAAEIGQRLVIVGPTAGDEDSRPGIEWNPGTAGQLLLAGDETAAPAICAILESLPSNARGVAFIEVPHAADALAVRSPDGVEVRWLHRAPGATGSGPIAGHGSALEAAVRGWSADYLRATAADGELIDVDIDRDILWEIPDATVPAQIETHAAAVAAANGADARPVETGLYAWLAGEAAVIKMLRRMLVSEMGMDRRTVAFMGYWRAGRSEAD